MLKIHILLFKFLSKANGSLLSQKWKILNINIYLAMEMRREYTRERRLKNLDIAHLKLKQMKTAEFNKLSNKIDTDFGYILGVILGDGHFTFPKGGGGCIGLSVVDKDFAQTFYNSLKRWSQTYCRIWHYRDRWRVYLTSVSSAKVFKNFDTIKILTLSEDIRCAFLRGLYDSDGNVNDNNKTIRFYNSNPRLINIVKGALESIGVSNLKIRKRNEEVHIIEGREYLVKPVYVLVLSRKRNLELFNVKVGFSIKRKQKRLETMVNSYQRVHNFWTNGELEFLKRNSHRNYHWIAKRLGRTSSSVDSALHRRSLKPKIDNRLLN